MALRFLIILLFPAFLFGQPFKRQEFPFQPPMGAQLNRSHPLCQGLVGCWLMNEGAGLIVTDACYKNNGTMTSGVYGVGARGQMCKMSLNASGINIGTPSPLQFQYNTPFTVMIWFYATSNTSSDLFGYADNLGNYGWYADWSGTASGKINFDFTCANGVGGGYYRTVNTTALSLNTWYCAIFYHNTTNSSSSNGMYINGVFVTQTQTIVSAPITFSYSGLTAYIGSRNTTANGFGGNI